MFYKGLGGVIIVISILGSIGAIKKYGTKKFGREIEVEITKILVPCEMSNSSLRPSFKFEYKGRPRTKKLRGKYCNLKQGDKLKLKVNKTNTTFVFLDEPITKEFTAVGILFAFGTFMFFKKEDYYK